MWKHYQNHDVQPHHSAFWFINLEISCHMHKCRTFSSIPDSTKSPLCFLCGAQHNNCPHADSLWPEPLWLFVRLLWMGLLYVNKVHGGIWSVQCRAVSSVRKIISNAKSWGCDALVHSYRLKEKMILHAFRSDLQLKVSSFNMNYLGITSEETLVQIHSQSNGLKYGSTRCLSWGLIWNFHLVLINSV